MCSSLTPVTCKASTKRHSPMQMLHAYLLSLIQCRPARQFSSTAKIIGSLSVVELPAASVFWFLCFFEQCVQFFQPMETLVSSVNNPFIFDSSLGLRMINPFISQCNINTVHIYISLSLYIYIYTHTHTIQTYSPMVASWRK